MAVEAGADAVGFVFYEKSPRCVTVDRAREIVAKLPANVDKVGVFVDESEVRIRSTAQDAALTAVQIYSESSVTSSQASSPEVRLYNFKVIVAMRSDRLIPGTVVTGSLTGSFVHAILIDSGSGDRPGGTGETFDWEKNREYVRKLGTIPGMRMIVAGGLKADNVSDAIAAFSPWGVDVVSGVEASPGKKDPEKVRAFVRAVREYDRRVG